MSKSDRDWLARVRERMAKANMSAAELGRRAGLNYRFMQRVFAGDRRCRRSTQRRIERVFKDEQYRRKAAANVKGDQQRLDLIRGLYKAAVMLLAAETGQDGQRVLDQDVQALGNAERILRSQAVYAVAIGNDVYAAELGRALDLSRAAVSRMIRDVEDAREDPAIDCMLEKVELVVSGVEW